MEAQKPKRISWPYVMESFLGIFNLEKGLLYTLVGLTIRPGKTLNTYLFEDRTQLTKPFTFFILTTTLAVLIAINLDPFSASLAKGNFPAVNAVDAGVDTLRKEKDAALHLGDSSENNHSTVDSSMTAEEVTGPDSPSDSLSSTEEKKPAEAMSPDELNAVMATLYQKYFAKYMQLIYWGLLPVIALFSYVFFGKQKLFYPEHFIFNTYVAGFQNLIYVILVPTLLVFGGNVIYVIYGAYLLLSIGYQAFAYRQFFTKYSKTNATWRAGVCIILSYVLFILLFSIVLGIVVGAYMAKNKDTGAL